MAVLQRLMWAAGFAAAMAAPAWSDNHVKAETVVATVGKVDITLGHMIAMVQILPADQVQGPPQQLFDYVLERLIQQEAVAQRQPEVSAITNLQLENERRSLLASQEVERIFNSVTVTEDDLQAAYNTTYGDPDALVEYNASHILVDTQEEAAAITQDLRAGADFIATAKEKSTGPSGPGGGSLGWFGPGRMVPSFETAVAGMEVGDISDPVETQFGWHVIRLNDKRSQGVPVFEDTREDLRAELTQTRFREALQMTFEETVIERPDLGSFDPAILFNDDLVGQ